MQAAARFCSRTVVVFSAKRSEINCLLTRRLTVHAPPSLQFLNEMTTHVEDEPVPLFNPKKAVVLSKLSRYEFEKKRFPMLNEDELKKKLALRGSDYNSLLYHHNIHQKCKDSVLRKLHDDGIDTRLVQRFDYTQELVDWADVVFTVGGDGTFLLAASKVTNKEKPVIGINSDPSRSEGYLCLTPHYSTHFCDALDKLHSARFKWIWRQRIRVTLFGKSAMEPPVLLHDQQLNTPENRFHDLEGVESHHSSSTATASTPGVERVRSNQSLDYSMLNYDYNGELIPSRCRCDTTSISSGGPPFRVLPSSALNEVFIGESLSSRVSYFEISIDGGEWVKQKSSGVTICTGTGSSSWYFNINKLTYQCVDHLIDLVNGESQQKVQKTDELVKRVTEKFNTSLLFDASEKKLAYTIRDPVMSGSLCLYRPRGFAHRIEVRSRCFDACLVVDGGLSFSFNDGARAIFEIDGADALRTIELCEDGGPETSKKHS